MGASLRPGNLFWSSRARSRQSKRARQRLPQSSMSPLSRPRGSRSLRSTQCSCGARISMHSWCGMASIGQGRAGFAWRPSSPGTWGSHTRHKALMTSACSRFHRQPGVRLGLAAVPDICRAVPKFVRVDCLPADLEQLCEVAVHVNDSASGLRPRSDGIPGHVP